MPRRDASDGRQIAREVLRRVRRDDAYAKAALAGALGHAGRLAAAERSLATELVYGVLRHRRLLDHALSRHARQPLDRMDAEVLDLLRLAAYQVLMLDRVPRYAAVDHAVGEVRRLRGAKVAGFANAVLRQVETADLRQGLPDDPVERLAVEHSLPDGLARCWVGQLGLEDARRLAGCLLERAPLTLRANTLRTDVARLTPVLAEEGAEVAPGRWAPTALHLTPGPGNPFDRPSYTEGLWTAQDEGAQLVCMALAPRAGETVLDACAGLGGKATHLAALMGDRGRVVCVDVNPRKLELLDGHCRRLGVSSCETRPGDLRDAGVRAGLAADRVLVDAPCTGLGVLRRHPELKWRADAGLEALPRLVQLQRELLEAALNSLRPGGVLVYSVCTSTEEEGPEQLRWLCERLPGCRPRPFGGGEMWGKLDPDADGMLRLWPHRHGTDGFYIARVELLG